MLLPWVRLHATKDYLEMVEHLERHPTMRATINLVPSLIRQIEDYSLGFEDDLLTFSKKTIADLSPDERDSIQTQCLYANYRRMIARSHRYRELYEKNQNGEKFTDAEIRDLIVHYHLAWTGEFKRDEEPYSELIMKERDFTEADTEILLTAHLEILKEIIPRHLKLRNSSQVELSTTPFYHPILPLLCDTDSALESTPGIILPAERYSSVEDACEQLRRSIEIHTERFGVAPNGVWPAEGSISDAALKILCQQNIEWTASDETVLHNSLGADLSANDDNQFEELEKYFPRIFSDTDKEIAIFFRDHGLSDKIGFEYSNWDARDAAKDFVAQCLEIRSQIIERFGEETLEKACISVILDGENCWEYYHHNGRYFLDELYSVLEKADEIKPVTMTEAVSEIGKRNIRKLSHVVAGSWIGGNFRIWIGHAEKNRAWDCLNHARNALTNFLSHHSVDDGRIEMAHTALLKAEGSDWFWWFGEDNASEQKQIFDELYRQHLIDMYVHLHLTVPKELFEPIGTNSVGDGGAMHRA